MQEYYGKIIKKTSDLQTKSCCTNDKFPEFALPILTKIHQEVQQTVIYLLMNLLILEHFILSIFLDDLVLRLWRCDS